MRFAAAVGIVALATLGACTRKPPEKMIITVSDGRSPVGGMEVFVNGTRVGVSDSAGRLIYNLAQKNPTHLQISVRPTDEKSTLMSRVLTADLPMEFFPKPFELDVRVRNLAIPTDAALPSEPASQQPTAGPVATAVAIEEVLVPPLVSGAEKIAEADLPAEQTAAIVVETPKPMATALPVLQPVPMAAPQQAKEDDVQKFEVAVTEGGKPLLGAQVFSARAATRSAVLLGTTGADGTVGALIPKFLRMEQVLVRHDCCKPVLRPVTGAGRFSVELEKGTGAEVVMQHDAFGISRAIPGTEVMAGSTRLDVAGGIGFVALPSEQLRSGELAMVNKDALPDRFLVKIEKSAKGPMKPIFRYAGMRKPAQPIVGLLETGLGTESERDSDSALWRRFRREFQGRFVQSQVFRPMIAADVQKLAASAKLSPESLFERGWEFSVVNPEMDFLAEIRFEKNPKRFEARLVDRGGNLIFRDSFDLKPSVPPEKNGAEAFGRLVSLLPFEGTVIEAKPDMFFANMGGESGRGIEKNQFIEVYSWPDGDMAKPRNELVGVGKISGVEPYKIQIHLTYKTKAFKGGVIEGMRVVRVSGEGRNPKTGERVP